MESWTGQTQFWEAGSAFSEKQWSKIRQTISTILEWFAGEGMEFDVDGLVFSNQFIVFNGALKHANETFVLRNLPSAFAFCNIVNKPFELLVGIVLVSIHQNAPNVLNFGLQEIREEKMEKIRETYVQIFGNEVTDI